ncbi:anthranilate phosphoribosyltransferase [Candidatus Nitrotoga arctica]|uniref:Anthranilate phosphoribosyltransferase n=1 Tax=Candidatus Nitrotoga arctica TaxID=453162 RepID=A0ABN8AQP4_9PROT|nr:anthranilate phosphoribosyltransferase [Candidatus Nitrotoga arctica]CAG9934012.1 Anthranilate phosphoribosyltransferase [Candidatus Nitrotoga arctica]
MNYASLLNRLLNRENLPHDDMYELMRNIMGGQLTPAQIAAVLVALHMKGETVSEIAAAVQVMRDLSSKVTIQDDRHLIDTCGTGGDGAQTFNISTASALVAAAAGARVAKHGGRSVSSTCGSADILEKLGVNVNLTPQHVAHCVQELGVGFMFAPNHHSAMKYAAPVRRELGVRTLFNLLGPLTNPAGAQNQVMGVFQRDLTVKLALVLQQLGSRHVLVVHGADGMDEISISGPTYIAELKNGTVIEYSVQPQDFDLQTAPLDSIRVANADEARTMLLSVLDNQPGAAHDIVQLNAGAAIYVAGLTQTLQEGVKKAKEVIASGAAKNKLEALVHIHI